MYTEMSHTPSTPKPPRKFQKCHNPQRTQGESHPEKSICCSWKKNPLLKTQGLPEGTGRVINSLSFSQNTFEERQRITSRVRKKSFLNTVNMQGGKAACPSCPGSLLSRRCLGFKAESLVLGTALFSHPTILSWQLHHKSLLALSLWP